MIGPLSMKRLCVLLLGLLSLTPAYAQLQTATGKPRRPEWWTAKTGGPLLTLQQFDTTTGQKVLELRDAAGDSLWSTTIEGHTTQAGYMQPGRFATTGLPSVTSAQAGALVMDTTANALKFVNNSGAWTALATAGASTDTLQDVTGRGATTTVDMTTHKITPGANTTYDLGASGTRWNNIYAATSNLSTAIQAPLLQYSTDTTRSLRWGTGSPNGVVSASVGSIYLDTAGAAGTTLYVKETGTGNTGWTAYNSAGGGGGYIDTDTLASVVARGASTTTTITTGDVVPSASLTYDLGKTGARWNNLWATDLVADTGTFGTSLFAPKINGGGHSGTVFTFCSGGPNGIVTADVGSLCLDSDGGARQSVWVKESGGISNTGWVGVGSPSDTLDTVAGRGATTAVPLTLTNTLTTHTILPAANSTYRLGDIGTAWSWFDATAGQFDSYLQTPKVQSSSTGANIITWGAGNPNSTVTASPGSLYMSTNGGTGTTLYIKETGVANNTGWTAVNPLGSSDTLQNVTDRGAATTDDLTLHNIAPAANNTYASGSLGSRWSSVDTVNVDTQTATAATSVTTPKVVSSADPNVSISWGSGSPNGAVTASSGAIYFNRSGGAGTTLWVKETGTDTNTGWVAYSASGGGGGSTLASPGASKLVRTDATGQLAAVSIGSGINFDGTTLSATSTGGGTSSDTLDNVVQRGSVTSHSINTGDVLPYQGSINNLGSQTSNWNNIYGLSGWFTTLEAGTGVATPIINNPGNLAGLTSGLLLSSGRGNVQLYPGANNRVEFDVSNAQIALSGIITGGAQALPVSPTEYLKIDLSVNGPGVIPTSLYIPLFAGPP